MKHSLAIVASLVATFVLGAVVALYGFGPSSVTADAVGCFALREGYQQRNCTSDVIDRCSVQPGLGDRSAFTSCLNAGIGGNLIRDENLQPAGDQQKVMPGRKAE